MPPKRKRMSEDQKQKVREGVWRHMFGPDWRNIVAQRKEAALLRVGKGKLALVKSTEPKDEYGNPLEGVWIPPLGKREFLRMLIVRLRGELPNREFVEVAKLYADIRRWAVRRAVLANVPGNAKRRQEAFEMVEAAIDPQELPPSDPDMDLNDMVRRLEEERKAP